MADSKLISGLRKRHEEQRSRVLPRDAIPETLNTDEPSAFDFSKLAAHKDLRMLAAAAAYAGIGNPFFQVHEGCAGATTVIQGRHVTNFASYNYLGLNGHREVSTSAKAAVDRYGTSAAASRLVAGERPVHRELETHLARFFGLDDALALVSGHATNVSVIGHLMGRSDLVICDELSHNSIFEGVKLSGAARLVFPHNDLSKLSALLDVHRAQHDNVLIVVEGLYSMDGDCPELKGLIEIKRRRNCWLMVDEAHSAGVLGRSGRGIAEEQGIDPRQVEIWMGTLSKTFASTGGYVAGSQALIDVLRAGAPGFVYSVGLPPTLAAAAITALEVLEREPDRLRRLRENSSLFLEKARLKGLNTGHATNGPVIPVLIGDSAKAVVVSNRLLQNGFNALPIIFPAVSHQQARLRFFITSEHTAEQIEGVVECTAELLKGGGSAAIPS